MCSIGNNRLLLANGARIDTKDSQGKTPLHEACRAGDPFAVKVNINAAYKPVPDVQADKSQGIAKEIMQGVCISVNLYTTTFIAES